MNGYRLSPIQRLAWSGAQDLVRARVLLDRPLDRARLQTALDAVVARHEALRLTLVHHPGLRVPLQDVDDGRSVVVGAQGELSVTVTDDALELAATPLIADPASLRLVLADLARAYADGRLADDPDALQFLDVTEWQLSQRQEDDPFGAPAAPAARLVTPHGDDPAEVGTATLPAAALTAAARRPASASRTCSSPPGRSRCPAGPSRPPGSTTRTWCWPGGATGGRPPGRPVSSARWAATRRSGWACPCRPRPRRCSTRYAPPSPPPRRRSTWSIRSANTPTRSPVSPSYRPGTRRPWVAWAPPPSRSPRRPRRPARS